MLGYGLPTAKVAFWLPASAQNHSSQMRQGADLVWKAANTHRHKQAHSPLPVLVSLLHAQDQPTSLPQPSCAHSCGRELGVKLGRDRKGSSHALGERERVPHASTPPGKPGRQEGSLAFRTGLLTPLCCQTPLLHPQPRFTLPSSCHYLQGSHGRPGPGDRKAWSPDPASFC